MQNLVESVKAHAIKNYEKQGWDYVVECYSDDDISAIIKTARTPAGAIKMMRAHIKPHADYRDDIRAEIF